MGPSSSGTGRGRRGPGGGDGARGGGGLVDDVLLDEATGTWTLGEVNATVDMLKIDHAVGLVLSNGVEVRIETVADVTGPRGSVSVDPESGGPDVACFLPLLHQTVVDLSAHADGSLVIRTVDTTVTVPASAEYEAWSATATDGAMLVSTPGGALAVWRPVRPAGTSGSALNTGGGPP